MLVTPKTGSTIFDALDRLHDHGIYFPVVVLIGSQFMFDLNKWDQNIKGFDQMFDRHPMLFHIGHRQKLRLAA